MQINGFMPRFFFIKKCFILIFVCWTKVGSLKAQDPLFTQYFSSPMPVNPAFSGVNEGVRINTQFRMNWINWPTPFKTTQLSVENYIPGLNSGFGMNMLSDDAGNGVLKTNQLVGNYAYQLQINKAWYIRFGMQAGMNQVQLNWNKLFFEDQIDPFTGFNPRLPVTDITPDRLNRTELDLGTGLLLYRENFYAGMSLRHINRFNQSFWNNSILETGRPMIFSIQAGMSPMMLYLSGNSSKVLQIGSSYHLGQLITGVWARFGGIQPIESMAGFGYKYGIYRIMYTVDISLDGKGLSRTLGSHELTLSLRFSEAFDYISKKSAQKTMNCFRFNN
jgi:type IX secretion system PorP/SprF family membrane protein